MSVQRQDGGESDGTELRTMLKLEEEKYVAPMEKRIKQDIATEITGRRESKRLRRTCQKSLSK